MSKKILLGFCSLLLSACTGSIKHPPETLKHVDLERYMGTWYEIAAFPNRFQRGCRCTSAHYALKGNQVSILNQCIKGQKQATAKGKAWPVANTGNSQLKVQFFWPFRGDYWILYLSKHYQRALVGSPNRQYLWVLARQKTLSTADYNAMLDVARKQGFDVSRLVKTKHSCPGA